MPLLGDVAWVPVGGKYLISISMLDRRGCTVTIKSGVMDIWGPDKKPLLQGRLNDKDMYVYYMPVITARVGALVPEGEGVSESSLFDRALTEEEEEALEVQSRRQVGPLQATEHYDARARERAKKFDDLHCGLFYPSDEV